MTKSENIESKIEKSDFSSRYTLEAKLGVGGMGAVYKAYDKVLDKHCAVKLLLPNSQTEAIIRFHHEAKTAGRLSHPNILTTLDFGQNEAGDLYLVMDYLDGQSLHDLLKDRGILPLQEALSIFLQICAGLHHAHSQGILHRDIKPSNIMLVKDERGMPQVKIVDFGLAKVQGTEQSLTTTGMRVGSPLYMSPEQAQSVDVDQRSDIYSLGCLMYKTLTGKVPLFGETFLITINKHISEIPISVNELCPERHYPSDLSAMVQKCLEKDPDDRYQTAQSLSDALMSLDLSIMNVVSSSVPLFVEDTKVEEPKTIAKKVKGMPVYLKYTAAFAAIIAVGVIWTSIANILDPKEAVKKTVIPKVELESIEADIMSDKLTCERDGSLSAQEEFGDGNMNELLPFKNVQEKVSLANSKVTGKEFAVLKKMKKLTDLNLSDTAIDDKSLATVGKLKKLTRLALDRDKIGDIGLGHLSGLKNLEELRIESTQITNLGLEALQNLKGLQTLDISGCKQITGAGLDALQSLPSLNRLSVVQCIGITDGDIERFRNNKTSCEVIAEGKIVVAEKVRYEDRFKRPSGDPVKNKQKQMSRKTFHLFMKYKNDMVNDREFYKYFDQKDPFKPRKDYSELKNPRLVKCLKDPDMQEVMKDPLNLKRWRDRQTWIHLQAFDEKIESYLIPMGFSEP